MAWLILAIIRRFLLYPHPLNLLTITHESLHGDLQGHEFILIYLQRMWLSWFKVAVDERKTPMVSRGYVKIYGGGGRPFLAAILLFVGLLIALHGISSCLQPSVRFGTAGYVLWCLILFFAV